MDVLLKLPPYTPDLPSQPILSDFQFWVELSFASIGMHDWDMEGEIWISLFDRWLDGLVGWVMEREESFIVSFLGRCGQNEGKQREQSDEVREHLEEMSVEEIVYEGVYVVCKTGLCLG